MSSTTEKSVSLSVPFSCPASATLACDVLSVDKELKGSGVKREIKAEGDTLHIIFHGNEMKKVRVAVNSTFKNILLIVKTISQFEGEQRSNNG